MKRIIPPFSIATIYSLLLLPVLAISLNENSGIERSVIFVVLGSLSVFLGHKITRIMILNRPNNYIGDYRHVTWKSEILIICTAAYYASYGLIKGVFGLDYNVYSHNLPLYIDVLPGLAILFLVGEKSRRKSPRLFFLGLLLMLIFLTTGRRTLILLVGLGLLFVTTDVSRIPWSKSVIFGILVILLSISGRMIRYSVAYDNINKSDGFTRSLNMALEDQLDEFYPLYEIVQNSDFFEVKDYALKSWIMWPTYFVPRLVWPSKPELFSVGKGYVLYEKNSTSGSGTPIYLAGTLLYSGGWTVFFFGSLCIGFFSGLLHSRSLEKSADNRWLFISYAFWFIYFIRLGDLSVAITQIMMIVLPYMVIKISELKWK